MTYLDTEKKLYAFLKVWSESQGVGLYTQALKDARMPYVVMELRHIDEISGTLRKCVQVSITLVTQYEGSLIRSQLLESLQGYLESKVHGDICTRIQMIQMDLQKDNFTHKSVLDCQCYIQTETED